RGLQRPRVLAGVLEHDGLHRRHGPPQHGARARGGRAAGAAGAGEAAAPRGVLHPRRRLLRRRRRHLAVGVRPQPRPGQRGADGRRAAGGGLDGQRRRRHGGPHHRGGVEDVRHQHGAVRRRPQRHPEPLLRGRRDRRGPVVVAVPPHHAPAAGPDDAVRPRPLDNRLVPGLRRRVRAHAWGAARGDEGARLLPLRARVQVLRHGVRLGRGLPPVRRPLRPHPRPGAGVPEPGGRGGMSAVTAHSARRAAGSAGNHLLLYTLALLTVAPFLWMVLTSFKDLQEIFSYPPTWWPERFTTDNYTDAFAAAPFGRFYFNSLFVAVVVTLGQLVTCSMAAYAFARMQFRGRDVLFYLFLGTMMVPAH